MSRFKLWLEGLESDAERKVREIWADTFEALGLGGLNDEDAAHQSLSNINYGARSASGDGHNTFKGKRAAYKRLENRQIFNRLNDVGSPEASKAVEDAKQWLGHNDVGKAGSNADTTVSSLLEKLFGFPLGDSGDSAFHRLIDSDAPQLDQSAIQKAPPQPPKDDAGQQQSPDMNAGPEQPQPQTPPDPAQAQLQPPPGQPQMPPQPQGQPIPMMGRW